MRWRIVIAAVLGAFLLAAFVARLSVVQFGVTHSDAIGYAGSVFNVLGLILVGLSLHTTRRKANEPSLVRRMHDVVLRLVRRRRKSSGDITIQLSGVAAVGFSGSVSALVVEDTDLKGRIKFLEDEIRRVRGDYDRRLDTLQRGIAAVRDALASERHERQIEDRRFQGTIHDMTVGELPINWLGFWLVLFGTIATGFPDALAQLFWR